MPSFLRRGWFRYPKLGRKRKKKQVWRRPSGRDNKMREKRRGYPAVVSIGYKTEKKEKGLINGKIPVKIEKIKDLEKIKKGQIGILGKMGKKKMIEIAEIAQKKGISFSNFNPKKILKKKSKEKKNKPLEKIEKKETKKGVKK